MTRQLLLFMAFAVAQAVPPAPPQAPATASLSGTIVEDDAGATPIARAVVSLAGAALRPGVMVVADDNGRFAFSSLPAGRFTLTASKAPYLTMSFGQKTPGKGTGVPIQVDAGQQISGVVLKLPRGSVISGRVLDARGQPVRGSLILLQQAHIIDGERKLTDVSGTTPSTDAQGFYRASGLAAGDYYICVFPNDGFRILIPDLYRPSGPELHQVEPAELQWAMQQLRAGGSGTLSAAAPAAGPVATVPPPSPAVAYGPMYFPGISDPAAAAPVTVAKGEERAGADVTMRLQRTARIEGRVVGPDGQPAANVTISIHIGSSTAGSNSADGKFSITNLLPGKVGITAQLRPSGLWASTEVAVNGEDVPGIVLTLQPPVTISGRLAFEATTLQPPTDLAAIRLTIGPWSQAGVVTFPVRADGAFSVTTMIPGGYRVMATRGPGIGVPLGAAAGVAAWRLKSVMLGGRDVADTGFEIGAGGLSDLVFTFTDRATELTGQLTDASGQPAAGYYIVVFSTDKTLWRQGGRQLPTPARSATDGQYRVAGLPPGRYYVAAIQEFDPADLADATFLTQLVASARTVTLGDGEKKVQDLRMAKPGGL